MSTVHETGVKPTKMDGQDTIYAVAFLVDGGHVVSSGKEGQIQCWQVEDGREVGVPMNVGSDILNITVS